MIIDVIIVALFLVAAVMGYNKGGLKLIASFGTFIVAFVLAYLLAETTGKALLKTKLGNMAATTLRTTLTTTLEKSSHESNIADSIQEITSSIPFGGDILTKLVSKINTGLQVTGANLAKKLVNYLFIGIGFMLVFITAKLVLGLGFFVLELVFELPLLKEMNKLLGLGVECTFMLIKIWMVFGLISFMSPIDFMSKAIQALNGTFLAKLLYDNNWLLSFVISIL